MEALSSRHNDDTTLQDGPFKRAPFSESIDTNIANLVYGNISINRYHMRRNKKRHINARGKRVKPARWEEFTDSNDTNYILQHSSNPHLETSPLCRVNFSENHDRVKKGATRTYMDTYMEAAYIGPKSHWSPTPCHHLGSTRVREPTQKQTRF